MSDMVERVARAMVRDSHRNFRIDLAEAEEKYWPSYEGFARLAIEALREPTDEMCVAGEDAVPALSSFNERNASPSCIAWKAMIDQALKP